MKKYKSEIMKFLKFNVVGVINSLISFVVFSVLSTFLGFGVVAADSLAFAAGMLNSWVLNSRWTFKQKDANVSKIIKFILINLVALLVSITIIKFLQANYSLSSPVAKIVATPFSLVVNFIGNKIFVFNKK